MPGTPCEVRSLHIDLPISLGILSAYFGSLIGWFFGHHDLFYFDFVAIFIFLMLAGRWLQLRAVEQNRLRARAASTIPTNVDPAIDGDPPLPLARIKPDDEFLTSPGQIVPVASRLTSESASLASNGSTAKPTPGTSATGAAIPAGALNVGTGPIRLAAREPWRDSLLHQLTDTSQAGSDTTAHPVANTILKYYLAAVLVFGFTGAAAWLVATADPARALQVLISLFVVSCPCALGVALPLADDLATSAAATLGVFVRRPLLWARLRSLRMAPLRQNRHPHPRTPRPRKSRHRPRPQTRTKTGPLVPHRLQRPPRCPLPPRNPRRHLATLPPLIGRSTCPYGAAAA